MHTSRSSIAAMTLGGLLALGACATGELTPQDRTAVIAESGAFLDAWIAARDAGQFDGLSPMYSDSAAFRWVEEGRVAFTSGEMAARSLDHSATAGYGPLLALTVEDIMPLSKDAAAVSADYTSTLNIGGGAKIESNGVLTAVLVKEDGAWKFLQAHLSAPEAALPPQFEEDDTLPGEEDTGPQP